MAHIGKFYKLQFRRDLAQVRNNRQAYPEAFKWSSSNTSGPVAADIINNKVPLVNHRTNSQPPMIWISDERVAGIYTYRARIEISDPFNIDQSFFLFQVDDTALGATLFKFTLSPPRLSGIPSTFSGAQTGNYQDSTAYKIIAGSFFWNFNAMSWAEYNP